MQLSFLRCPLIPEYECPFKDQTNFPSSAEFGCDVNTQAYCNTTSERCCVHGAGTRCVRNSGKTFNSMMILSTADLTISNDDIIMCVFSV